jgi:CheY-like chemotaxis protein
MIASTGQLALELLSGGNVNPNMIFLDLNMPLMNGRQFLIELNQLNIFEEIPIIVITTALT